ncbi:DUF4435 domain-containing protein [Enterobacter cloacae]|nr:DUF4435 domain-containing protein [Enterobacter cloacae]
MSNGIKRSPRALSVINRFERKDFILYVEGPSDRSFWQMLLDIYEINNVGISIAGSCTIIDQYIEDILNEDVMIFVARDKDYKFDLDKIPNHERILVTYGHSIENSLVLRSSLINMAIVNGGEFQLCSQHIREWINIVIRDFSELIIREFANEISSAGVSVFGDNCDYIFGKKSKGENFSQEKITLHLSNLDEEIPDFALSAARELFNKIKGNAYWYIRGHFLFSVALKFIKGLIRIITEKEKEPNISNDSMIMMLSQTFRFDMISGQHPHREHYIEQIEKLKIGRV